jgi:hypothetical protein
MSVHQLMTQDSSELLSLKSEFLGWRYLDFVSEMKSMLKIRIPMDNKRVDCELTQKGNEIFLYTFPFKILVLGYAENWLSRSPSSRYFLALIHSV